MKWSSAMGDWGLGQQDHNWYKTESNGFTWKKASNISIQSPTGYHVILLAILNDVIWGLIQY